MPAGYGVKATAREGMLPWSYVSDRMADSRNYWIATTRPDGRPHVAPVWGVWLDETFQFATDPGSRKGRNLAGNRHVAVHLESGDEVVVVEGTVKEITDSTALGEFADAYEAKYQFRPDVSGERAGVYAVLPRVVLAWTEKDFPKSATRWDFRRD